MIKLRKEKLIPLDGVQFTIPDQSSCKGVTFHIEYTGGDRCTISWMNMGGTKMRSTPYLNRVARAYLRNGTWKQV